MEREAEYEKLVRTGSHYDDGSEMGHVVARVADTKAWRDEIKAKARADKIKVRTGLSNQNEHVAWAYLKHLDDKVRSNDYGSRLADHLDAVQEAFGRARLRGHTVNRVIRAEGTRAAAACPDCGARLHVTGRPCRPSWKARSSTLTAPSLTTNGASERPGAPAAPNSAR